MENIRNYEKKSMRTSNGFTLIEVMIAVIILAVGILAVSQMTILGHRSNTVIKQYMEGREALARGMEVLKILPISDPLLVATCDSLLLDSIIPGVTYQADTNNVVGQTIGEVNYDIYWNVADDFPKPDHKTIHMIVKSQAGRFLMNADYVRWR